MIVFRLSSLKYAKDFRGKGAEKSGGRWNSKGVALIYTSQSRALCTTEIAVHTPLGNIPIGYEIITIEIPDTIFIKELSKKEFPKDWKALPHAHSTQLIGDKFVREEKHLILKVPSVVVDGEFNYLINPNHPDIRSIIIKSIEPFTFDKRLFIR